MIRRGKQEGWLSLPSNTIPAFAKLNSITINGVQAIETENKGMALVATERLEGQHGPLITVPHDLILSKGGVSMHARLNTHLREVLDACGDFAQVRLSGGDSCLKLRAVSTTLNMGQTPRHSILIFLLVQATISCPQAPSIVGMQNPFIKCVQD